MPFHLSHFVLDWKFHGFGSLHDHEFSKNFSVLVTWYGDQLQFDYNWHSTVLRVPAVCSHFTLEEVKAPSRRKVQTQVWRAVWNFGIWTRRQICDTGAFYQPGADPSTFGYICLLARTQVLPDLHRMFVSHVYLHIYRAQQTVRRPKQHVLLTVQRVVYCSNDIPLNVFCWLHRRRADPDNSWLVNDCLCHLQLVV